MRKKKIIVIQCLALLILLIFFLRLPIVNKIQTGVLKSIDGAALLSNTYFGEDSDPHGHHKIYKLKGTERILPHRVNSMERFRYLYNNFKGFECDIILSDGHLYVAHDPEEISLLTWEHLLGKDVQQKIFWLDVKNLNLENVQSFYARLDSLNDEFSLKDRIIIESGNPVPLKLIADSGYLTSLYFPVNYSTHTLSPDSSVSLYIGNTGGLISQDVFWLSLMNKSYPGRKKLIWDISFCTSVNADILKKHIADTTILLCLINVKSPGYR